MTERRPRLDAMPTTLADEIGRLAAEPHVLAHWRSDSNHPRLIDAYAGLAERVEPRLRALVTHPDAQALDREAVADATIRAIDEAKAITFELSRLKWLVANRRARLMREGIPGYAEHEGDEESELEHLETLLGALGRGLC